MHVVVLHVYPLFHLQLLGLLFMCYVCLKGERFTFDHQLKGKIPNLVCIDRGYLYEELLHKLISYGCSLLGTLKRSAISPFHYGDAKHYSHQTKITEKGPRASYYKHKALESSDHSRVVQSFVGAHRNGTLLLFNSHNRT